MNSLKRQCQQVLLSVLLSKLQSRKRSLGWKVSLSDWVLRMGLEEIRDWLEESVTVTVIQDLLQVESVPAPIPSHSHNPALVQTPAPTLALRSGPQEGLQDLYDAQHRDLLLCVITLTLGSKTTRLEIPHCLLMDEVIQSSYLLIPWYLCVQASRLYLLEVAASAPSLQVLLCTCYREGCRIEYISQKVAGGGWSSGRIEKVSRSSPCSPGPSAT